MSFTRARRLSVLVALGLVSCGESYRAAVTEDPPPDAGAMPDATPSDAAAADAAAADGSPGDSGSTPAEIVFDGASAGTAELTATLSFAHTVAPGDGRILIVAANVGSNQYSVASVTYGGKPLAIVAAGLSVESASDPTVDCTSVLFYLVDPPLGTADVVASLADQTLKQTIAAWAISFHGVDGASPLGPRYPMAGTAATATSASVGTTSSADELVVDSLCLAADAVGTVLAGAGQTERVRRNAGSTDNLFVAASTAPGDASRTMSWTFGDAVFVLQGLVLRPLR